MYMYCCVSNFNRLSIAPQYTIHVCVCTFTDCLCSDDSLRIEDTSLCDSWNSFFKLLIMSSSVKFKSKFPSNDSSKLLAN